MDERYSASEARGKLAEIINEVAFGGRRFVLQRHGKDVAAVVSASDLALLEAIEDRLDLEEARAALQEGGKSIHWDELRTELAL